MLPQHLPPETQAVSRIGGLCMSVPGAKGCGIVFPASLVVAGVASAMPLAIVVQMPPEAYVIDVTSASILLLEGPHVCHGS